MRNWAQKGVILAASLVVVALPSGSYVLDGLLNDWGVTPFVDWAPVGGEVNWSGGQGEDNQGGAQNTLWLDDFGGESFDAEAFYFDDADGRLNFALVTSAPQSGVTQGASYFPAGDIALTLGAGGLYKYGIKTSGEDTGKLYLNPVWNNAGGAGGSSSGENGSASFSGGTLLGKTDLVYADLGVPDNGLPNYVIEGSVSKSLLASLPEGEDVQLRYVTGEGNDAISVNGRLDAPAAGDADGPVDNPVPEPATMTLFGVGALGLGYLRHRKNRP